VNVGLVLVLCLGWLAFGLFVYSRVIARAFGANPSRPTPAVRLRDGVDYVPTAPGVLFGHHFASIAAAGPIVGPALAAMYGVLPALLWLLVGVVFIGAVHDYAALKISVREDGRSMAEVARRTLGPAGFILYSLFALFLCVLVSAAFLDLTAKTLTAQLPLSLLGLPADQTLLATSVREGVTFARVGGIASTSVVLITLFAPVLGYLLYRRRANAWACAVLALLGCVASVAVGLAFPLAIAAEAWMGIVLCYTVVAGFVPVWLVIQPRDFVNVQFLYAGLAVMVLALIGCGVHGVGIDMPTLNFAEASTLPGLGAAWPILFVTIACGSVSGAHGLIASGTTSKQLTNERHARWIGYGGMLLECLLGICVLLLIVGAVGYAGYKSAVWEPGAPGAGIAFALALGQGIWKAAGAPQNATALAAYGTLFGILLLEGFLVTTIDTVVRLSRYLLEEVWRTLFTTPPRWLLNRALNTTLVVLPVAALGFGSGYKIIWPIFGSANQLLAALTLIAAAVWLVQRVAGRAWMYAALPAGFMVLTTVAALWTTLREYLSQGRFALAVTAGILLVLSFGVLGVVGRWLWQRGVTRTAAGHQP
jgi:carbon starvation protein